MAQATHGSAMLARAACSPGLCQTSLTLHMRHKGKRWHKRKGLTEVGGCICSIGQRAGQRPPTFCSLGYLYSTSD